MIISYSSTMLFVLLLFLFLSDDVVDGLCSGFCTNRNKTLNVYRTEEKIYIKGAQFMKLTCCMSGFKSITWEKLNKTSKTWTLYPWFGTCLSCSDIPNRELCDNDQAYVVRSTTHWDAGHYRCNIRTSTSGIQRKFHVNFIQCEDLHGQVIAINLPPPAINVRENVNVTLICRGYFGCRGTTAERRVAYWSYLDADGRESFLSNRSSDRFHVSHGHRDNDIIKDSILDISQVQSSDYGLTFQCNLVSGTAEKKTFTVHLCAPVEEIDWNVHIVIIASICVAVFMIFIVAIVISCYLHHPQILYHYKRRYDQLPKRGSEFEYDVTVLCSETNESFVQEEIVAKLKEFNYDVSTEKPNTLELSRKADAIARSFCTMVIYSEAELVDNTFSHLFNVAAMYNGLSIIVIEQEPIPASFWQQAKKQLNHDCQESETLKHIPKILKTVKWPGTDCKNKRKINNFWSEIRANLPVAKQCTRRQTDVDANNPRRPLLYSGDYGAALDVKSNDLKVDVQQNISHDTMNNSLSHPEV